MINALLIALRCSRENTDDIPEGLPGGGFTQAGKGSV
jgi:hypothetical protein